MFVGRVLKGEFYRMEGYAAVSITDAEKSSYKGVALLEVTLLICAILHLAKVGSFASLSAGGRGALVGGAVFLLSIDILISLKKHGEIQRHKNTMPTLGASPGYFSD